MIIAYFINVNQNFRVFVGKFTKTVGISYNIGNFKAKVSNVHDDKYLGTNIRCQHREAMRPCQIANMSKLSIFLVMLFFLQKKVPLT